MKKNLALIVGITLLAGSVFAAGYVNANDVNKGTFTNKVELDDGFAIYGTAEKDIRVDAPDVAVNAPDGETFTQRINTRGTGSVSFRSVSFPVKAGEKVTIYGHSSSKTDTRTLLVVDADGNTVFTLDVTPYATSDAVIGSFTSTTTGTLYIWSKSGGTYIYSVVVE